MPQLLNHLSRTRLAIAVVSVSLAPMSSVSAGDLIGTSHTVLPADPVEAWTLSQNASLTLSPGSNANAIVSAQSSVLLDSGTVRAADVGLELLNGSSASVRNGSLIVGDSVGLRTRTDTKQANAVPSTVGVVDSSISGKSIGVQLSGESSFVSSGSTISGTGTSGIGLYLVSGDARLTAGTSVSGIRYGIRIVRDDRGHRAFVPRADHRCRYRYRCQR